MVKTKDRILIFIESFSAENGYAPTIREIGEAVGLRSTSTVHGHVERLVEKGLLIKETMLPRTARSTSPEEKVTVIDTSDHIPSVIEWQGRIYCLKE
jgi:SOS-response transcriptional repressor LexA